VAQEEEDDLDETYGGVVIANRSADVTALVAGEAVVGSHFTLQAGLLVRYLANSVSEKDTGSIFSTNRGAKRYANEHRSIVTQDATEILQTLNRWGNGERIMAINSNGCSQRAGHCFLRK
jgi:hypothetical protein